VNAAVRAQYYAPRRTTILRPPITTAFIREVIRKEVIEKHWPWLIAFLVLTVASAVIGGVVVSGWVSVGVSLTFAIILFFTSLRAITRVRTIETYPPT